ncbi:MAG: HAD family hydrolase [Candidatus Rokuibacteriota bacterium]
MTAELPDILALDFDGVLCEGMREYFDTSRRTYTRLWPDAAQPGDDAFLQFHALRPVILTGWEMPLLLRAIVQQRSAEAISRDWPSVRDAIVQADGRPPDALVKALGHTLDAVRREWIATDLKGWLERNVPYCDLDEVRRLVAEPRRSVLVTTKEGEFARLILESWKVSLADIQGKEAGTHKCENLRSLIAAHGVVLGRRPRLWFVEDRLETLQHVTTHPDLSDVGLFLAAWGYNTPQTRASLNLGGRIRLLQLDQFRRGLTAWPAV